MRILFVIVLLLAASAGAAGAQAMDGYAARMPLPALLAPTPAAAGAPSPASGRGTRASAARTGSVVGAFVGALMARYVVCEGGGEGNAAQMCTLAGIGVGAVAGGVAGWIVGAWDRAPR